ncbi:MAG: L-threonylcarbamoyladenylate synthase [Kiritimatiellia bacterium]|jgi:L-threonylcarbamoyladenylate synthase
MNTRITRSPAVAAKFIGDGLVVAFPTETVYGLGADALNPDAVKRIFKAKGRPADNPLIVHMGDISMLERVAKSIPRRAESLMTSFFPGPLTLVLPRHPNVPLEVTAGLDTVGVRFPAHPVASAFLKACCVPVAAPSANRSGRPSPTTWGAVDDEMNGRISCILKGGPSEVGLESTVVDCTGGQLIILRQGAVSLEMLRAVAPKIRVSDRLEAQEPARSPGLKYRHYAPRVRVVLVDHPTSIEAKPGERFAYIGLTAKGLRRKPVLSKSCRGVPAYARSVFAFFRACEQSGATVIYAQRVEASGLGRALMDRLQRAADDHPKVR